MAFIAWWQSYVCNLMTCLTHCKVTSRRHYICWDNMERVLANIVLPPTPHPPPAHDPQKMLHCHQVQFFKLLLSHGSDLLQIKIRPPCLNSCLSKHEKVNVVSEDVLPIQSWTVPLGNHSSVKIGCQCHHYLLIYWTQYDALMLMISWWKMSIWTVVLHWF